MILLKLLRMYLLFRTVLILVIVILLSELGSLVIEEDIKYLFAQKIDSVYANYIYLPQKWDLHGLSAKDIEKMQVFSQTLTQKVRNAMLISQPTLEYIPIQIKRTRWIYVIVVKKVHGVFISKKDLKNNNGKTVVKQGVLYVRSADTTAGSDESNVTSADEHIRVWMDYINYLSINPNGKFRLVFNNEPKIGDQKNESTWPID